jgi:hypothetical protein
MLTHFDSCDGLGILRYLVTYRPAVVLSKIELLHYHRQISSRIDVSCLFFCDIESDTIPFVGCLYCARSNSIHVIYRALH